MSLAAETLRLPDSSWTLWRSQIMGILALELRKTLFGRRSLPIYFLALLPVMVMSLRAVLPLFEPDALGAIAMASVFYAGAFKVMIQLVVFLGCVFVFMNLFRGEVIDEVLHYYFLTPVRREVLAAGKFLAGLVATSLVFGGMTVVTYALLYLPHGIEPFFSYFLGGPGIWHLLAYLGITLLACVGYGAVFMLTGLVFRNPVVPAALILGWEGLNPFLPTLLKKISVVHYLYSLTPVPVDVGPFALIAEPTSAWVSVPGFVMVAALFLWIASMVIRRMEICYGGE